MSQRLSIVIPTYGRNTVLCDTIAALLDHDCQVNEIIVMDQTPQHDAQTEHLLSEWQANNAILWCRLQTPSTTGAMNQGVLAATGDIVLFLDDDIISHPNLLRAHMHAHDEHPDAWAVVGQVLQPGENPSTVNWTSAHGGLRRDIGFPFYSNSSRWIENAMAGNLSVKRKGFLELGGFDEKFRPPVAYRFETEFVRRVISCGGRVLFEPAASIRHLRVESGGTRSRGSQWASASPIYGEGDYYYALRCGHGWDRLGYILRRPFRQVRTKFHLRHPWWIPPKFIGELRAIAAAFVLYRQGPQLMGDSQ
ncbi:MAG: glycosyltransferase [Kiritimatiellia bacterium]|jgi:GT2 family glycosyltransferase|nr:glycosyltransferase [Kiritimatiellia bacterium]